MLRTKEIQKIRVMYYEQGYTTTEIVRIMKISRDTVHKYTQFMDMSTDIKVSRNANKMAKYKDEMIGILNYDRLHHYKQHHTGSRVYEIYDEYGIYLQTVERISGKPGSRWIHWAPYIRLLADKPAAIYNFSFLDLFKDNEYIIEKITKIESIELKSFLLGFANMIEEIGLDKAIEEVDTLL